MDRQMAGQWGAMEAARDFLEFVLDDGRTMSLSSYLEEIRLHCLNLVRALLLEKTAGAWYVTLFATIMSGVCEIARLFVADTAPVYLPPLVNSAGWEAYLKASPLAMGGFWSYSGSCGVRTVLDFSRKVQSKAWDEVDLPPISMLLSKSCVFNTRIKCSYCRNRLRAIWPIVIETNSAIWACIDTIVCKNSDISFKINVQNSYCIVAGI